MAPSPSGNPDDRLHAAPRQSRLPITLQDAFAVGYAAPIRVIRAIRVPNLSNLPNHSNASILPLFSAQLTSAPARLSMPEFDTDLQSIQEAHRLAEPARDALRPFMHASQAEVDRVCAAMAEAAYAAAERLGRLASEETGH